MHTRSQEEQTAIIKTFSYLRFEGPVKLQNSDEVFVVHELWSHDRPQKLLRIYFGRLVKSILTNSGE